ncbi:3-alpha-hydroxycholanate dehydrogenase (NADP(+)) (plasmid) [Rhodococcus ruber]|uniref:SDR family oxidoreductase n=1 Tax=Rhodococcus ruber TaxID=1830 RepID=UPI00315D7608
MAEYDGMRTIITGGSAGLGLATAELLVSRGAQVAICGRDQTRLDEAAARLAEQTDESRIIARSVDVTEGAALCAFIDEVADTWGGLDGLVNSAGVHTGDSFMAITDEQWQSDFEVKLLAAIKGIRLAVPVMQASGGGSIVNVLSVFAKFQPAGTMPSSVFRSAGLALTNGTAAELAPLGIRVNEVLIGFAESDQWVRAALAAGVSEQEFASNMVDRWNIPMGRAGTSNEAAEAIAFLLAARASYLTGTCFNVDGGLSPVI